MFRKSMFFVITTLTTLLLFSCSGKSVNYDGNGSTFGEVPVDTSKYSTGASVTVLGNEGELFKPGSLICAWNTKADGSGTNYMPDKTIQMGVSNITLYAKWADKWTKTFYDLDGFPMFPRIDASVVDSNNNLYYGVAYIYSMTEILSKIIKRDFLGNETVIEESNLYMVSGMAIDAEDNLYISGSTVGGVEIHGKTGTGGFIPVVLKYNSEGVFQWITMINENTCGTPCASQSMGTKVAVDSTTGVVFITGYTNAPDLEEVTALGDQDGYVAKYNPETETLEWLIREGSALSYAQSFKPAVEPNGDVYLATWFLDNGGIFERSYVKRYNTTNGTVVWQKDLQAAEPQGIGAYVIGVALDGSGEYLYVTGGEGDVPLGEGYGVVHRLSRVDGSYSASPWPLELKPDTIDPYKVALAFPLVDEQGYLYVLGYSNYNLETGEAFVNNQNCGLVKKISPDGSYNSDKTWTRYLCPMSIINSTNLQEMSIDPFGNTYVSGSFYQFMPYDPNEHVTAFISTILNY